MELKWRLVVIIFSVMEISLRQKISNLYRALRARVKLYGPFYLIAFFLMRLRSRIIEWQMGINTRGWIDVQTLGGKESFHSYDPVSFEVLRQAFSRLKFTEHPHVLVDYGCGKGRVLAVGVTYPFKRVIGVEFSDYLCSVAKDNLTHLKSRRRCSDAIVVEGDAAKFVVPDDATVFFLYNPFSGEVLDQVVHQIEESLKRAPREVMIYHAYFNNSGSPFAKSTYFQKKKELPIEYNQEMSFQEFVSKGGHLN